MKQLKQCAALVAAVLALGMAGCSKPQESQAASSTAEPSASSQESALPEMPPETLRIGVMYSTDIVPLAVMQAQGLDEKHGVKLDMQVFSSARDRDAALQAGELDGVFTDYIGVCIYQNAGLDVKITGVTDGDYFLLAGPYYGVTDMAGAQGKSIAISENTLIEYTLDYLLEEAGKTPDYMKKEVVPKIPDRVELLRMGKVDLGLLPDPFAALARQGGQDGAVLLGSANASGLYPAVSAFLQSALDSKGDAVRKFYAAYDEAVDYVNATPVSEYEDVIIEGAGYPEELRGSITLPEFRKHQLPEAADLARAIGWASAKGLCEASLTPEQLLGTL